MGAPLQTPHSTCLGWPTPDKTGVFSGDRKLPKSALALMKAAPQMTAGGMALPFAPKAASGTAGHGGIRACSGLVVHEAPLPPALTWALGIAHARGCTPVHMYLGAGSYQFIKLAAACKPSCHAAGSKSCPQGAEQGQRMQHGRQSGTWGSRTSSRHQAHRTCGSHQSACHSHPRSKRSTPPCASCYALQPGCQCQAAAERTNAPQVLPNTPPTSWGLIICVLTPRTKFARDLHRRCQTTAC